MKSMNPRKCCATAKHLGLDVEYVPIDFTKGGLSAPEYLALNPNGRAPVLEDEGKTIWESAAIMLHLALKAGSSMWPANDPQRQVEVLRWISWDAFHFAPHAGTIYFENYIKPQIGLGEADQRQIEASTPPLHQAAAVLDAHLAGQEFVAGDRLTIADFCVGVLLPQAEEIELPLGGYANIQRWHAGLMKLEAWRNPWPE
jgi:glutathione S-transferase